MQRAFTTFPNSWPGYGLVLLRCCAGLQLLLGGSALWHSFGSAALIAQLLACLIAALLIAGLWTPFAGIALVLLEVGALISGAGALEGHIDRAVMGLSLAMLGPGASSIDARLFGRRRIDLDDVKRA